MPVLRNRTGRQLRFSTTTFQAKTDVNGPVISGYFAVFNSDYVMDPLTRERIAPGAFSNIGGADVRALIDHVTYLVLGRTIVGTLLLREDDIGLWGEIRINENDSDAMNLYARVQRGDVSQCSIGFDIEDETYEMSSDGQTCTWIIIKVILYEVSVVTFPAYETTSVEARAASNVASLQSIRRERRKNDLRERIKKL